MQRLEFEPAEHTDFIFEVIDERWPDFLTLLGLAAVTGAILVGLSRRRRRPE